MFWGEKLPTFERCDRRYGYDDGPPPWSRTMSRICGIVSLVILALSAAVHVSTFVPAIQVSMDFAWPLHIATMLVFVGMVFSVIAQQKLHPAKSAQGLFAKLRAANEQSKEFQSRLLKLVSRPLRVVCMVAFFYTFINFGLFFLLIEGGNPELPPRSCPGLCWAPGAAGRSCAR